MVKLALVTLLVSAAAGGAASLAAADTGVPTVGTTQTVRCHFAGHATTSCREQTVVVTAGPCWQGLRLYSRDELDSVRAYRGNVILPGQDGVTGTTYGALLRPHARLVSQSVPHAFTETFPLDDQSCLG